MFREELGAADAARAEDVGGPVQVPPGAPPIEETLRRHGPMVLGVCRRILKDPHEADDAFQATFLLLARKESAAAQTGSVGGWLHHAALNVSMTLRRGLARRRRHETKATAMAPTETFPEEPRDDLRAVLDEELGRLPEIYRAPLVLCYLEGKTNDEAASEIGCSKGTVSGRLARARDLLRGRLDRRGIGASALLLALSARELCAEVAPDLFKATAEAVAASPLVPGAPGAPGPVSAEVEALAGEAARNLGGSPIGSIVGALAAAAVAGMTLLFLFDPAGGAGPRLPPPAGGPPGELVSAAAASPSVGPGRTPDPAPRPPLPAAGVKPAPEPRRPAGLAWAETVGARRRMVTLWRTTPEGRPTPAGRIQTDWPITLDPFWAARKSFAYSVGEERSAESEVFLMDPATGGIRHVGHGSSPRLSPDGGAVACLTAPEGTNPGGKTARGLVIRAVPAGTQRRVTPDSLAVVDDPEWSPDGRRLAFSAEARDPGPGAEKTAGVYLHGPGDKEPVFCAEAGAGARLAAGRGRSWSFDGRALAVANAEGRIGALDPETRKVRWFDPDGQAVEFGAWSPDGKRILVLSRDRAPAKAWLLDADRGTRVAFACADFSAGSAAWSPDGTSIAVIRPGPAGGQPGRFEVVAVPVGGGDPVVVTKGRSFDRVSTALWTDQPLRKD